LISQHEHPGPVAGAISKHKSSCFSADTKCIFSIYNLIIIFETTDHKVILSDKDFVLISEQFNFTFEISLSFRRAAKKSPAMHFQKAKLNFLLLKQIII